MSVKINFQKPLVTKQYAMLGNKEASTPSMAKASVPNDTSKCVGNK